MPKSPPDWKWKVFKCNPNDKSTLNLYINVCFSQVWVFLWVWSARNNLCATRYFIPAFLKIFFVRLLLRTVAWLAVTRNFNTNTIMVHPCNQHRESKKLVETTHFPIYWQWFTPKQQRNNALAGNQEMPEILKYLKLIWRGLKNEFCITKMLCNWI